MVHFSMLEMIRTVINLQKVHQNALFKKLAPFELSSI
jgi:hypothetical protein